MNRSTPGLPVHHRDRMRLSPTPHFPSCHTTTVWSTWTPRVHSDSHPSSQSCHPAISSSVVPFSFYPQSLPASESSNESTLRMRWPKYWSFSFSIIPSKKSQSWSSEWTGRISLQSKGLSRVFSNTTVQKHQSFSAQPFHSSTLTSIHDHRKNHSLD